MSLLQLFLFPFTLLYAGVTWLRNILYDKGLKQSFQFPIPVISVGNLNVGGTGKTPHVEYLIRLLKDKYKIATLSRGYGRETKGFILADKSADAAQLGDEPMQFYHKFASQVSVAVGERRVEAIAQVISQKPETNIILLDDAFQHRSVKPSFSVLLTSYHKPFYRDFVLPAGRLRECRAGVKRADVVIVSKCPEGLDVEERIQIEKEIHTYTDPQKPIYFTGIRYGKPIAFGSHKQLFSPDVILVSGLADSLPLEKFVKNTYILHTHLAYKDHQAYTLKELTTIKELFHISQAKSILVTEKDFVKLNHPQFKEMINELPFFYLPIEVHFLFGLQHLFDKKVRDAIVHHSN